MYWARIEMNIKGRCRLPTTFTQNGEWSYEIVAKRYLKLW